MYSIEDVAYCGSFLAHLLKNVTFMDTEEKKKIIGKRYLTDYLKNHTM